MVITVYRYGTPSWIELPAEVDEQLFLAHQLREDLVTLEHQLEEQIRQVWSSYPAVAAAEAMLLAAEREAQELGVLVKRERSAQRTKAPRTPLVAQLKDARVTARAARQGRRDAIATVAGEAKTRLAAIRDGHRAAVKATYAEYVQGQGLYWATWNDVVDHHKTAVQMIGRKRKAGQPAALRHHRWDGSGSVAVQLQRQAGMPDRAPALLASGDGTWRNVFQLSPWIPPGEFEALPRGERRQCGRGVARISIGGGRTVDVPVIVHRMLPADADVTGARLVVTRVAKQRRIALCVTARVPDPAPRRDERAVALHLGWRRDTDDGALRVGVWRTTAAVAVPAYLAGVVVSDSDRTGQVVLPGLWRDAINRADGIRADRDTLLDEMRARLVEAITAHPDDSVVGFDGVPLTANIVRRWKSPLRLARLALFWREHAPTPGWANDVAVDLEAWRRLDGTLWEREAHGRAKALGRRDDLYRKVAAWLVSVGGMVVVDDTDLAKMARISDGGGDLPSALTGRAASQRVDAASGRLRSIVAATAAREGVTVQVVDHTGITRTHARCGYVNPADDRYARSVVVVCDGCGQSYDQDRSAAVLMLARDPVVGVSGGAAR
jgi:hypothetical protein